MKVRDVNGPAILSYPSRQSVPVVASPDYQRRVGPGAHDGNGWYPPNRAIGLGADDVSQGAKGSPGYGFRKKLDYGYEDNQ